MGIVKGVTYFFDSIIGLIKYVVDSLKLSILKLKLYLFIVYLGIFSLNYFINFKKEANDYNVVFEPQEVPESSVVITSILVIVLIGYDIFSLQWRVSKLSSLLKSNSVPNQIKEKIVDELIKSK